MDNAAKLILVVEDEEPLRHALITRLNQAGFRTVEAKDGAEGLVLAKDEHPDLILLDLLMPKVDGLHMLEDLRVDEATRDTPIIILTNSDERDHVSKAVQHGAYEYLIKADWSLDDIVAKVHERLAA